MSRFAAKVIEAVETPDFGTVRIRALTAAQYVRLVDGADSDDVEANMATAARMVAMSLCEADGTPIEVGEPEILDWPARDFNVVSAAVMRLNRLEKKGQPAASGSPAPLPNDSAAPTLDRSCSK